MEESIEFTFEDSSSELLDDGYNYLSQTQIVNEDGDLLVRKSCPFYLLFD